jgi:hypothetical protein
VRLRVSKPDLERPYRIPFNTIGCCLLLVPPILATCIVLLLASFITYAYALATILAALAIYKVRSPIEVNYDFVDSSDTTVETPDEESAVEIVAT